MAIFCGYDKRKFVMDLLTSDLASVYLKIFVESGHGGSTGASSSE